MDLPTLFTPPATEDKYFLAVLLTDKTIQSALWKVMSGQIEMIQESAVLEYVDDNDCVVKTDESLQDLGKESETVEDVVFGLPPTWVQESGIADFKKPLLKKITEDLTLKAVGFVVTTEAVIQNLVQDQPHISALLINLNESSVSISNLKQGKIVRTEQVGKSGDTIADLTEALARLKTADAQSQAFPSKVFFFSAELSEEEVLADEQLFIGHDWVNEGWFLHQPVVETFKASSLLEAIIKQGGKAVAVAQGLISAEAALTPLATAAADESESDSLQPNDDLGSELGFNEVGSETPDDLTSLTEEDNNLTAVNPKSFGVPIPAAPAATAAGIGVAAAASSGADVERAVPTSHTHQSATVAQEADHGHTSPAKRGGFKLPSFNWDGLKKFAKAEEKQIAHHPFVAAGFVLGLVALALTGFLYLKFTSTAVIAVQLKTVPVNKEVSIVLDPQASSADLAALKLPAQITTKDITGSETVPTTGVKLTGEKAKGKVTFFNKTTSSKTFAAGTVLASGKYQFTLDQEVTIASASVSTNGGGETKTYGKTDATVTAAAIGPESNIAKDAELKIASFDTGTYSAGATEAFSGGSSREIRVVAETDRQKALTQVKEKVFKQAETEFKQSSGNGTYTVPSGKITVKTSTYDAKTGDEAESISLEIAASVEGVTYKSSDLTPLAKSVLQSQVPSGYQLVEAEPSILSSPQAGASSSASVKLEANLSSQAQPQVAAEVWQKEVAGLSLTEAEQKLKSKPEVMGVDIKLNPALAKTIVRALPGAAKIVFEFK